MQLSLRRPPGVVVPAGPWSADCQACAGEVMTGSPLESPVTVRTRTSSSSSFHSIRRP